VAHEGRNTLAMLVRRKGETLAQLLTRLDLAIARAQTDDIFTDEINPAAMSRKEVFRTPASLLVNAGFPCGSENSGAASSASWIILLLHFRDLEYPAAGYIEQTTASDGWLTLPQIPYNNDPMPLGFRAPFVICVLPRALCGD